MSAPQTDVCVDMCMDDLQETPRVEMVDGQCVQPMCHRQVCRPLYGHGRVHGHIYFPGV